jgi:hypothetical protein
MGNRKAEFCGVKEREEACDPLPPPHSSHSLSPCQRGLLRLILLARRISTLYTRWSFRPRRMLPPSHDSLDPEYRRDGTLDAFQGLPSGVAEEDLIE